MRDARGGSPLTQKVVLQDPGIWARCPNDSLSVDRPLLALAGRQLGPDRLALSDRQAPCDLTTIASEIVVKTTCSVQREVGE